MRPNNILLKDIRDKIEFILGDKNFFKLITEDSSYYLRDLKISPIDLRNYKIIKIKFSKPTKKDKLLIYKAFKNVKFSDLIISIYLEK